MDEKIKTNIEVRASKFRRQDKEPGISDMLNCIYFHGSGLMVEVDELRTWVGTWDYNIAISET